MSVVCLHLPRIQTGTYSIALPGRTLVIAFLVLLLVIICVGGGGSPVPMGCFARIVTTQTRQCGRQTCGRHERCTSNALHGSVLRTIRRYCRSPSLAIATKHAPDSCAPAAASRCGRRLQAVLCVQRVERGMCWWELAVATAWAVRRTSSWMRMQRLTLRLCLHWCANDVRHIQRATQAQGVGPIAPLAERPGCTTLQCRFACGVCRTQRRRSSR